MSTTTLSNLSPELEQLAQRFVSTLQAGDVDGWFALYGDDGVTWHSYDGREMTAAENAELLRPLFEQVLSEFHYDDIRRYEIEGGYVQQHTLHMTAKAGGSFETGVCIVVKVVDGKVHRLDEYLDSSVFHFSSPEPAATA